jgi:hypothetical protein
MITRGLTGKLQMIVLTPGERDAILTVLDRPGHPALVSLRDALAGERDRV